MCPSSTCTRLAFVSCLSQGDHSRSEAMRELCLGRVRVHCSLPESFKDLSGDVFFFLQKCLETEACPYEGTP